MNVLFRADSSTSIGAGHIVRCLALAHELALQGDRCVFACRSAYGDATALVAAAGFQLVEVAPADGAAAEADATYDALVAAEFERTDWLVVDHYALDHVFESLMRKRVVRIAVVADAPIRQHDCDVLIDHNIGAVADAYTSLVPCDARVLTGPRFALLRRQFAEAGATEPRNRDGMVRRVLVSFGGTDPTNETAKAIEALRLVDDEDLAVDVVLPELAPHRASLVADIERMRRVTLHGRVENMAELMASADLMLGAGGVTLLERCTQGLPSVSLVIADNQASGTAAAAAAGATVNLGDAAEVSARAIAKEVKALLCQPDRVRAMARAARELMGTPPAEGPATAAGLMRCMTHALPQLRRLSPSDTAILRRWRNSDRVRLSMSSQHIVTTDEHWAWFAKALEAEPPVHFVYECGGAPLGLVTFRDIDELNATCEWGFYIGEAWAPRRSGVRMGLLAIDRAFGELRLAELRAKVLANNIASIAYHAKMGFSETGTVTGPAPDRDVILTWRMFTLSALEWPGVRRRVIEELGEGDPK